MFYSMILKQNERLNGLQPASYLPSAPSVSQRQDWQAMATLFDIQNNSLVIRPIFQ